MSSPRLTLSPQEKARLDAAPRKPPIQEGRAPPDAQGTRVTTKAYDVIGTKVPIVQTIPGWSKVEPYLWDHQYTEFDDGRERYIARGGPSSHGLHAIVTPSHQSPDRNSGGRVIYEGFAPGKTSRETIAPVAKRMQEIDRSGRPYGLFWSNSNWAMSEGLEGETGRRIGDRQTPGYRAGAPPAMPPSLGRR
jgi:hypothetical protein